MRENLFHTFLQVFEDLLISFGICWLVGITPTLKVHIVLALFFSYSPSVYVCVKFFPFYKKTSHTGLELMLTTLLNLIISVMTK